jgi:hypothetical protein
VFVVRTDRRKNCLTARNFLQNADHERERKRVGHDGPMVQLKGVKNAYMLFFKKKKKTWLTFLDNDVAHQIKKIRK